jgi:hypothetical protein
MKDETFTPNIFRPFGAGRGVDVFLGLKPQAESCSPFGTKTDTSLRSKADASIRTRRAHSGSRLLLTDEIAELKSGSPPDFRPLAEVLVPIAT